MGQIDTVGQKVLGLTERGNRPENAGFEKVIYELTWQEPIEIVKVLERL